MVDYRLYSLGADGRFCQLHEIHAVNDAEALQKARDMKLPTRSELWVNERLVARLGRHRHQSSKFRGDPFHP